MSSAAPADGRSRVQAAVHSADHPLTVDEVSAATGLHVNTVRGHLDVLLAAGTVARESAGREGRGRPRWLYHSQRRVASPFQFLAEALTTQLAHGADADLAAAAAERWAHAIPDLPAASTPDEAVDEAVAALNRLGFSATATAPGDAIGVTGCPYADLVDANPVICDIHTALLSRLLEQTGQPVTVASMDVWARTDLCVARLRRPDLSPSRRILVSERGFVTPHEGTSQ